MQLEWIIQPQRHIIIESILRVRMERAREALPLKSYFKHVLAGTTQLQLRTKISLNGIYVDYACETSSLAPSSSWPAYLQREEENVNLAAAG